MRQWVRLVVYVALVCSPFGYAPASAATLEERHTFGPPLSIAQQASPSDSFTPLVARTLAPATAPVLGTDGKYHVVYELALTNAKPVTVTMQKVEVSMAAAHLG